MPIQRCTLPNGGSGWRWGKHGKCYKSRRDAERQAAAIYASGYADKKMDNHRITSYVQIQRIDSARQIAFGVVYSPNELDTWGECMLPSDVELMAHRYMQLPNINKTIDMRHDNKSNGSYPIESFIARKGDLDYPEGSWVLGIKVPDQKVWKQVEGGTLNGFSFQALVKKVNAVVELELTIDNLGRTEDCKGHAHIFWAELDEDGVICRGRTSTVDGHSHEIIRGTATEVSMGHSHRFII